MIEGLYAIVNFPLKHPKLSPEEIVSGLKKGGAQVLQLRMKKAGRDEKKTSLARWAPVCSEAGLPLVVNDDPSLALSGIPGIRGLHLGQDDIRHHDLPELKAELKKRGLFWGLSTHSLSQLKEALTIAPDYLALGPIFSTRSKEKADPRVGVKTLIEAAELTREAGLPLVAIGGIGAGEAKQCFDAGVQAVASIAAIEGSSESEICARANALSACFRPLEST